VAKNNKAAVSWNDHSYIRIRTAPFIRRPLQQTVAPDVPARSVEDISGIGEFFGFASGQKVLSLFGGHFARKERKAVAKLKDPLE
jgi:hypothetical protein